MNRTLKTAGVSLALLTACLSANTVFADGQDKADISCSLSFFGNRTNISWNDTGNSKISSYKLYVSEPLSPVRRLLYGTKPQIRSGGRSRTERGPDHAAV